MKSKIYLIVLIAGILFYTVAFTVLCSLRYKAFFSYEWEDEAAEHQIVWNTAHGNFLHQTIYNNKYFIGHFSPIYVLVALFYRIFPKIYSLYFIYSFMLGAGALPVYFLAIKLLDNKLQSALVAVVYLLYPPLHWINFAGLEPVMLSVSFLLSAFYLFFTQRYRFALFFIFLALMCKENIAFCVIFMGIYFALKKYNLKWSLIIICLGLFWYAAVHFIFMPTLGNIDDSYGQFLGGGPFGFLKFLFFKPVDSLGFMLNSEKLHFLLSVFKYLLFLPVFSVVSYIGMSDILQIMSFHNSPENQAAYYLCGALPFIFIGLIFFLGKTNMLLKKRRLSSRFLYVIPVSLVCLCLYGNFTQNIFGFVNKDEIADKRFINVKNIYDKEFFALDERDRVIWRLIKQIPPCASVSASGNLLPALSGRKDLLEFAFDSIDDGGGYDYFNVDYILVDKVNRYHGSGHYTFPQEPHFLKLTSLINKGTLQVLYETDRILFLKKIGEYGK